MNGKFWNCTHNLAFLSNGNANKIIIIGISVGNWKKKHAIFNGMLKWIVEHFKEMF